MKLEKQKGTAPPLWFRRGVAEPSSDEQAIAEVIIRRCYRRVRSGFDVLPFERWLDLGANIGAFAYYCRTRQATAVCFEPEPTCFKILRKNAPNFKCFNAAVTASSALKLTFMKSANPQNHYRGTVLPVKGYQPLPPVDNFWAGSLDSLGPFNGIKMDIEGSEGAILDEWLLPPAEKLVMEYHTSRDSSVAHLKRRLEILQAHYKNVKFPKLFADAIEKQETCRPRFDQLIFAWGLK